MKKYKLLKTYPGIYLNVGDIVVEKIAGLYFSEHCNGVTVRGDYVEKFPEFWKEMKEYNAVFISEDGLMIFDGQTVYTVFNNYKIMPQQVFVGMKLFENLKYFSTKKAAENYVRCNFPCMSFNDVWNMSKNKDDKNGYVVISKADLKQFTQSLIF